MKWNSNENHNWSVLQNFCLPYEVQNQLENVYEKIRTGYSLIVASDSLASSPSCSIPMRLSSRWTATIGSLHPRCSQWESMAAEWRVRKTDTFSLGFLAARPRWAVAVSLRKLLQRLQLQHALGSESCSTPYCFRSKGAQCSTFWQLKVVCLPPCWFLGFPKLCLNICK